jgi:hypothetical protein
MIYLIVGSQPVLSHCKVVSVVYQTKVKSMRICQSGIEILQNVRCPRTAWLLDPRADAKHAPQREHLLNHVLSAYTMSQLAKAEL